MEIDSRTLDFSEFSVQARKDPVSHKRQVGF